MHCTYERLRMLKLDTIQKKKKNAIVFLWLRVVC